MKIGARHGALLNLTAKDLKGQVADLALPQTADSHPESSQEERDEANAMKFDLDVVGIRAYELNTLSNIVRVRS